MRTRATIERPGRMRRLARPLAIATCLLALGLSGCLDREQPSSRVEGDTLTVYSSVPATGSPRRPVPWPAASGWL
jgi:hypothetical protein